MAPVPPALLAPPALELVLVLLPPQAASVNRAVTPAAAVRCLAHERADNPRAGPRRPARGRLAAKRALVCAGAEQNAGAGLNAGVGLSADAGLCNCLGLIVGPS